MVYDSLVVFDSFGSGAIGRGSPGGDPFHYFGGLKPYGMGGGV